MARVYIGNTLQTATGAVVTSATCTVRLRGTTTAATLYSAETGGTTLGNPVSITSGIIDAWVNEGSYDLAFTGPSINFVQPFEAIRGDRPVVWYAEGLAANRPAVGSVPYGYTYKSTDVAGGLVERSNGTSWVLTDTGWRRQNLVWPSHENTSINATSSTEYGPNVNSRLYADLSYCSQVRAYYFESPVYSIATGVTITVQYSLDDGATWNSLSPVTTSMAIPYPAAPVLTSWGSITSAAQTDMLLRVWGANSTGSTKNLDLTFLHLQVR